MGGCAMRLVFHLIAILATRHVHAFLLAHGGQRLSSRQVVHDRRLAATVEHRYSRGQMQEYMVRSTTDDIDPAKEQDLTGGGPFSILRKSFQKAASSFRIGPFSRSAKEGDAVDDLLNSDAFLNKKVQMLEKQIRAKQGEIEEAEEEGQKNWEEWGPKIDRLEKEFTTLKSRGGEARLKAVDKAKAAALNDILGVADNFERGSAAMSPETDGEQAVVDYYQGVYDTMMKCLEGLGLEEVEQVGARFDYNIHNAIMRESTDEFEEDVVCKVYQKGYRVGDTLVRPAMVAVAAPP